MEYQWSGICWKLSYGWLMLWIGYGTLVEWSNKRGQGQTQEKSLLILLLVCLGIFVAAVLQNFCFLVVLVMALSHPHLVSTLYELPSCAVSGALCVALRMWQKSWDTISKVRW